VNLENFLHSCFQVITRSSLTEMHLDWELTGGDVDDCRRPREEELIQGEIFNPECCRHHDELEWVISFFTNENNARQ